MRAHFVVLAILYCCVISTNANAENYRVATQQKRWEHAFRIRMDILEQRYGFTFDSDWEPRVTFGAPPGVIQSEGINGWYIPRTRCFILSRGMQTKRPNLQRFWTDTPAFGEQSPERDSLRELIDHELGHSYTDQVHRRLGLGPWLTKQRWDSLSIEDRVGFRIISEGIATYYGSTSLISKTSLLTELGVSLFPTSLQDTAWSDTDFAYEGGGSLVRPILEQYGERGLIYLITHCLTFSNGDVRSAAIAYQQQALNDLAHE